MKKRIGLFLSDEQVWSMDDKIKDMPFRKVFHFNMKEVNLYGAYQSFEWFGWKLFLTHPEFDEVAEGCECPNFRIDQARKRYPFLFSDTNPILYRRFYSDWKAHWHTWRMPKYGW